MITDLVALQPRIEALREATGKSVHVSLEIWWHTNVLGDPPHPPAVEWDVVTFDKKEQVVRHRAGTLEAALTSAEAHVGLIPSELGAVVTP
jgi:hypothetical protein